MVNYTTLDVLSHVHDSPPKVVEVVAILNATLSITLLEFIIIICIEYIVVETCKNMY